MKRLAVIAHAGKTFDGGLGRLRSLLAEEGHDDPLWFEIAKSREASKRTRDAIDEGASLVLVWGGDGTVQRVVDALPTREPPPLGVLPAGTANLFATNLGLPTDLPAALATALHGADRRLDVGRLNGERFGVMAGAGFDARTIAAADGGMKDRFGRFAYLWAGLRATRQDRQRVEVEVDGTRWFRDQASCVLFGNFGAVMGGITVFDRARPDDGLLEVGVVSAAGPWQWVRVLSRTTIGSAERSPLVDITSGRRIEVRLERKTRYELDGGARPPTRRLKARVEPAALTVRVPVWDDDVSTAALVPETYELSGDDARETLHDVGLGTLLSDSFRRFRLADGFSHARSLAFMTSLIVVQGVITLVGLATALGQNDISQAIVRAIETAAPGPAGQTLTAAVSQAEDTGLAHRYLALALGVVGCLITGTTAMGQLERGLNRLYGVEQDRASFQKYGLALGLALSAGVLLCAAFALIALGRGMGADGSSRAATTIWRVISWPVAALATTAAVTLLFRRCPCRRQPGLSWLAFGATVSVSLWFLVTVALGGFFGVSSSFGTTYGPLAGVVALQIWTLLSAIVVLFGAAVAAQLEAVRAGRPGPQDRSKVALSEPSARPVPTG